mgnify:CR=1 FL=1
MDFFEHQVQAKAASRRLLFLFIIVCVIVILCVDAVLYSILMLGFQKSTATYSTFSQLSFEGFLAWQLSLQGLLAASVSITIISIGCFKRWFDLRKGGNGLAVHIGARSLGFASKDDKEQQLINVVEEMAIASGISPPGIYVLDAERSINAFVAGYDFEDSALIVTNGLLTSMDREELQAVVGHEFSHILHGDNLINIRLMVLIAGFVWVAELGRLLIPHHTHRPGSMAMKWDPRMPSLHTGKRGRGQTAAIGLPLIIIGSLGTFLGRLIRTTISRKREFLADASSVQFTRNPQAMARALNVIRENSQQGYLHNARAEELSHMCISPSKRSSWFATHPPIENRINAIDDTFLKRMEVRERKVERAEKREKKQKETKQATQNIYSAGISQLQQTGSAQLHDVIGTVSAASLEYAMSLHDEFPYEYRQAMHSSFDAKTMMLYLLLNKDANMRAQQKEWIIKTSPNSQSYLNTLTLMSQGLPPRLAMPLVELLLPVVKQLSDDEKQELLSMVLKLAKWDGKLSIFEICLYSLLKQNFANKPVRKSAHVIKKISIVNYELNVVISSLIHVTGSAQSEKEGLYARMVSILGVKDQNLLEKTAISPRALYDTLNKLKHLSPMLKRSLMDVCGDIVLHDGIVRSSEYETLRLMSLLLACPMPAMPVQKAG